MTNLISNALNHISVLLNQFQVKRFLSVVMVGFVLLTTNADLGRNSQSVTKKLDEVVHQDASQRPKTTGEWNKEARETEGAPGERVQRIAGQSAEALKDFGTLYPDTAERSLGSSHNQKVRVEK